MYKLISIFIVLLLVISVPFSMAQYRDRETNTRETEPTRTEPTNVQDIGRIQTATRDQLAERLRRANAAFNERARAITGVSRQRIKDIDVRELKQKLRECKESDISITDCSDLRKESRLWTKNSLARITEKTLNFLQRLKENIENSDIADKDNALEEINSAIEKITAAKERILLLTRESPKEEIKSAISALKESIKEARELLRKYHSKSKIPAERLENAINKFETLAKNIENRLSNFEARGYDFTNLRTMLSQLNSSIEKAKENLANNDSEATLSALQEAHKLTIAILHEFRASQQPEDSELVDGDNNEE